MGEITFTIPPWKALISPSICSSSQMNLQFNISSNAIPPKNSRLSCFSHRFPKSVGTIGAAPSCRASIPKRVPARDRIMDFGKYKGKMLGSLPSNYLKWISKHLRAGDTEEWAKLADEVLGDPVYRYRIEWEFAEKILSGNSASASSSTHGNAVSALLEISERFGWDNEDKVGWSKIDFGLLGTSRGGRIPRVGAKSNVEIGSPKKKEEVEVEVVEEDGGRRKERRERLRQRRLKTSRMGKVGDYGRSGDMNDDEGEDGAGKGDQTVDRSPFPGREALLNKVLNRRRL
ncbi:hypothetical protein CDL12_03398 [Handroanthus impetiginosus]|uniref:Uncharacterized protein n=1 Tax=Handroanthus impetiginosus TaxID=429701 RepID=A0A2G9I2A0_9LAMI|nr:hypothetical protein CDL12_03398 [Handroanthus impetiginosus]